MDFWSGAKAFTILFGPTMGEPFEIVPPAKDSQWNSSTFFAHPKVSDEGIREGDQKPESTCTGSGSKESRSEVMPPNGKTVLDSSDTAAEASAWTHVSCSPSEHPDPTHAHT